MAKAEFIRPASKTAAAGGGGGGGGGVTLVDIESQLHYQQFEYSLILLNSFRYPPNVDQGCVKITIGGDTRDSIEAVLALSSTPGGDLALDLALPFETHFK